MRLPGVDPYSADLALIRAAGRSDALFLDVYIRKVLHQLYFGGAPLRDDQLREFVQSRWGLYQGYAAFYLTTDTEAWAKKLGVSVPLRSAALSDPATP